MGSYDDSRQHGRPEVGESGRGGLTSLCGDDGDVVPLLLLAVQLYHRGDEAGVRADTEDRLRVRLRIDGIPDRGGGRWEREERGEGRGRRGERGERGEKEERGEREDNGGEEGERGREGERERDSV